MHVDAPCVIKDVVRGWLSASNGHQAPQRAWAGDIGQSAACRQPHVVLVPTLNAGSIGQAPGMARGGVGRRAQPSGGGRAEEGGRGRPGLPLRQVQRVRRAECVGQQRRRTAGQARVKVGVREQSADVRDSITC